jgi:hypothetical protein
MRTCGVEQAEQGRLEERQDGEGAAPIPKRAGASSIVTLQGAMNIMACGEAEDEAVPAHHT